MVGSVYELGGVLILIWIIWLDSYLMHLYCRSLYYFEGLRINMEAVLLSMRV